jgi:hypothetical protein
LGGSRLRYFASFPKGRNAEPGYQKDKWNAGEKQDSRLIASNDPVPEHNRQNDENEADHLIPQNVDRANDVGEYVMPEAFHLRKHG